MPDLLPFYNFLNKFIELSVEEFDEHVQPYIVMRRFGAKKEVSHAGAVENYFNFLLTGLARTYYKKGDEEIVIQIASEGQIVHAEESFHSRAPSQYTVETLEPSLFASITYNGLEMIYGASSKMQQLGRLVITFTLLLKEKHHALATTLSPRERFLHFVGKNADLMQRVPQKYLASYLAIQPETFSRFKRLIKEL